jgi:ABC-type lipoprotein release transport system permease subunit
MIFMRAALISVLAAGLTLFVGFMASVALGWHPPADSAWAAYKPTIQVIILPLDMLLVSAGALICCMFGSIIPARRASKMDPFEAIVEGRFR